MPSRRAVLRTGGLAVAALAGCAEFAPGGAEESVTRTADPGSATALIAFTPNGRVRVEGTDTGTVTVNARKRAMRSSDDLSNVEVVAETVGDTVQVRVEKTTDQWPAVQVDLDVTIPAKLVTERVQTGNGRIELTNTRGATAAETGNGRITATDYAGFPRLTSGNGAITATGGPGVTRAFSGNGAVDVEIREIDGETTLGSGNGDLIAHVASDLACRLELDTGTGQIRTGSLAVEQTSSWRGHLSGTLNGGGDSLLRATTGNGDVVLQVLDE